MVGIMVYKFIWSIHQTYEKLYIKAEGPDDIMALSKEILRIMKENEKYAAMYGSCPAATSFCSSAGGV